MDIIKAVILSLLMASCSQVSREDFTRQGEQMRLMEREIQDLEKRMLALEKNGHKNGLSLPANIGPSAANSVSNTWACAFAPSSFEAPYVGRGKSKSEAQEVARKKCSSMDGSFCGSTAPGEMQCQIENL